MQRDKYEINRKLKQYLKDHGIKQVWLAQKTGIGKIALSQILSENRILTSEEFLKICEILKLNSEYFLE